MKNIQQFPERNKKKEEPQKFCSEFELGKFLVSNDIIRYAYRAISNTTLTYGLHPTPSGIQILAFTCPADYTTRFLNREFDLVSSENNKVVDFISTKVNPSFSINKAAVELFEHVSEDLKELEKNHIDVPLVITGWGLGGYLAILFALQLQYSIDVKESDGNKKMKRPICITFGTPLLGDVALQSAISERLQWKSSFLNVVAENDPLACIFSSNTSYKPLGTSLFCTESGGHTTFENEDYVLEVLDTMASSNTRNIEIYDYGNVLKSIRRKVMYRGVSRLGEINSNLLTAGITMQFKEVDVFGNNINNLINKVENKRTKTGKTNAYEPTKKLNDMKISLTYMEWYMKTRKPKGGYYDSYKNAKTKEIESLTVIVKHQRILNQYWKKITEEKNLMPQKEGSKLRKRWLYGGTNYRRIVEPLDIADYYKKGKTNYLDINNRPEHYRLLEMWSNEEKKDSNKADEKRNQAASLTEDSCFWARVEEALISLKGLTTGGVSDNKADIEKGLEKFEADLMLAINNYSLSSDIFLEGSSLMEWWKQYKKYKGTSYVSNFAIYMNNKSHESYE